MKKAQIDLQIKQAENRAIAELQNNMMILDEAVRNIDENVRNSHSAIIMNIASLTLRVNFLLEELKSKMTEEEKNDLENRFREFARTEREKMNKNIAERLENE